MGCMGRSEVGRQLFLPKWKVNPRLYGNSHLPYLTVCVPTNSVCFVLGQFLLSSRSRFGDLSTCITVSSQAA